MRKFTKCLAAVLALLLLIGMAPVSAKPMEPFVPKEYVAQTDTAPAMNIIEDGASEYVIVRGINASSSEITAAEKLQEYLERISGCALPIVTDEQPVQSKEIIVGKTNREGADTYQVDRDAFGDDGFILKTVGDTIVIAGGEQRGALYGVFDFLQKFLGCRWFSTEVIIIPETATVAMPKEIDVLEAPAFKFRNPQIVGPMSTAGGLPPDYALANKINGTGTGAVYPEEYGGALKYNSSHDMYAILPAEAYFGEHPDWYAMDAKGNRVPDNPCLSNEEVIQFLIDYALRRVEEDPGLICIGMGLNDSGVSCQCEACRAIYAEEGCQSAGTLVRMINRVCAALREAGSETMIGTFAYAATIDAPHKTKLDSNAVVYFAPIGLCYAHPMESCAMKDSAKHRKQLQDWKNVTEKIVIFDYPCNYNHYQLPRPSWAVLQPNIKYFYENNSIGLINCSNMRCDMSLSLLNTWLYAKLLWDPYQDMEALYADFLPLYYGDGWQYIREYLRVISEELTGRKLWGRTRHFQCCDGPGNKGMLYMKRGEIKYCDDLWENAKALAKEDWQLANVRRAEVSYRVWKADRLKGEFLTNHAQSSRQLLADIWELGVTQHNEDYEADYITIEDSERLGIYYLMPRYWSWRQLGRSTKEAKNFPQMLWRWLFG